MATTTRIQTAIAVLLLASGCSSKTNDQWQWQEWIDNYNRNIVKVADADLECQVTEGERKASKFYVSIKAGKSAADTFVRSDYYDLAYDPGNGLPAITEGPTKREMAESAARQTVSIENIGRKGVVVPDSMMIGNRMSNFGVDRNKFCLNYFEMPLKKANSYTASCTYWYDPADRTIVRESFQAFKQNGEIAVPMEGPIHYEPFDHPAQTVEKAVCRPSKVKLR